VIYHHYIMRTTIDIDDPILKEVKKLQQIEGKSLGRLISELLAQALQARRAATKTPASPRWFSRAMGARVDLLDKDALYAALEQPTPATEGTEQP
jgi:hypothetical protein